MFTRLSFGGLLASAINAPSYIRCISLNNEPCMTRPTLIDLNSDKYNRGSRCYLFLVNLDICYGSCKTLDDLVSRICVFHTMYKSKCF